MAKALVYILSILGINVAVTLAAAIAFMLFLFRGDPILAAVPVVLVAPAIILQPWFVAFLFMPKGLIIAPFLTTAITVFVYGSLNRIGMLERPKFVLSRFKNRKTFILVGGFILFAVGVAFARYVDFPSLHQGLPPSVNASGLIVTDSRYYCLGSFIDSEWLWQAAMQESELASFADKYDLRLVDSKQVPDAFRRMPPYWWHPPITNNTKVFSTPDFPINDRGPDGWHALAIWNPEDRILYAWVKDNF
jgi:hypothetical protein